MATEAQIAANQKNAQFSTGPVTSNGKNRSSHNAVKTGLTGQTVLLPSDDVEAYKSHLARMAEQLSPANDEESSLVQAIADTEWRLLRIPSLESGIRAIGRLKLADLYPTESDPVTRAAFIDAEVQIAYRKDLSNLALQESRLRRHREVDSEKLKSLQEARKQAEKPRKNMYHAVNLYKCATRLGREFVPELFGFEFSSADIQRHIDLEDFKDNMTDKSRSLSPESYKNAFERFVPVQAKKEAA